jgi:hypothetical protein
LKHVVSGAEDSAHHQIAPPNSANEFNRKDGTEMPRNTPRRKQSPAELRDRIDELEAENEALNDKLDSIRDLTSEDDDDEDDDAED